MPSYDGIMSCPYRNGEVMSRLKSKITNGVGDAKEEFPRISGVGGGHVAGDSAGILIDRGVIRCRVSRRSRRPTVGDASPVSPNKSCGVNVAVARVFDDLPSPTDRRPAALRRIKRRRVWSAPQIPRAALLSGAGALSVPRTPER